MPRSICWTLSGWFGLLLAIVLLTFGTVLYLRATDALRAGVDDALESRGRAILAALEWDETDGWELDLTDEYLRGVAEEIWFDIRDEAGVRIRHGGRPAEPGGRGPGFHDVANHRELVLPGPRGTSLRIGRSIGPERRTARTLLLAVAFGGLALLVMGVWGSWLLANRSLRPVQRMSRVAAGLSHEDLSGRIDLDALPAELLGLGHTLNETFARLEAAFERQARFTADASHELRTPVAVIRAQAESMLVHERTSEEYRTALEACLRAAVRMSAVVDGLLVLARLDAGGQEVSREPVDLRSVVEDAVALARDDAEKHDINLRCTIEPVDVRGDETLLAEVVSNLLTNAIRYNRPGGHVEVTLAARNGSAVLEVADDGIGIPAHALPQLFERFYRVDPARSGARGGSGLGLAITRWIVDGHGGRIDVDSREEVGSTFTVTLPIRPPAS